MSFYEASEPRCTGGDGSVELIIEPQSAEEIGDGIYIRKERAVDRMASLVCTTNFDRLTEKVLTLLQWVAINNYTYAGALRELHLFGDPTEVCGNEEVVLELQIPVDHRQDLPD